jgi:hypothetical protein
VSEYLKGDSGSTGLQEHHAALLSLHGLAQPDPDPGLIPGFRRAPTGVALRTIAQASLEEVPVSARIGVLGDLARVGFPDLETSSKQYRELAASVADARSGVEPEQLLDDLKLATTERVPFHTLTSGRTLPHHEAAFVGEDVCTVREVLIGSLKATWIFSEFETDAPFDSVAAWVDPRNWPERGPMLFKGMDLVGDDRPVSLPPPGDVHWHGIFREEVQLVKRVRTLLHCDYWQDAQRAAGMTYSLALSLDDEIDVDQGFLLVNDVGPVRRVKALKIVGFTESIWDQVAGLVCPFWTEWVRAAVQGGGDSRPVPPPPTQDGARAGTRASWLEPAEQWIDSLGESARGYLSLLDEMGSRYLDREARPADLLQDQQRLFSQLAQDWAHAWTCGLDSVAQVAREGVDARMAPPDRSAAGARSAAGGAQSSATSAAGPVGVAVEGTTVPVGDLGPQDAPTVSDLVSIEAGGATIPASAITTTVEPLGADGHGARLRISTSDLSPGLYVGSLTPRPGGEPVLVQVYISLSRDV